MRDAKPKFGPDSGPYIGRMRYSLLTPGRYALKLGAAWEWWILAALYVVALAIRWTIRDAQPYTAEASHFAVSLNLWDGTTNIGSLHDVPQEDFSWFFWQRPLLTLPFWPVAHLGFVAYRTTHILLTSLIPVLGGLLLRQLGTKPLYTYAAAVVLCVHPALVTWNVLVLPDSLMAFGTLTGLLLVHRGRIGAAAFVFTATGWVKEVGFVTPLVLAGLALLQAADGTRFNVARLRDKAAWRTPILMLSSAALCFLPLAFSLTRPGAVFPGFRLGVDIPATLERLFLLVWLAPIVLLGLLRPNLRRFVAVCLAWPAFFLVYTVMTHKAVEIWYNVVPATMSLLAAAAVLGEPRVEGMQWPKLRRVAVPVAGVALALLLLGQVTLVQGDPINRDLVTPLTHNGQWDLQQALAYEHVRETDLIAAMASVPADHRAGWMVLDMDWSLVMYPVSPQATRIYKEYTPPGHWNDDFLRWWDDAIENRTTATIVFKQPWPVNDAIREGFKPCVTADVGNYVAIVPGPACRDRWDEMVASMHAFEAAHPA